MFEAVPLPVSTLRAVQAIMGLGLNSDEKPQLRQLLHCFLCRLHHTPFLGLGLRVSNLAVVRCRHRS